MTEETLETIQQILRIAIVIKSLPLPSTEEMEQINVEIYKLRGTTEKKDLEKCFKILKERKKIEQQVEKKLLDLYERQMND